MSDGPHLDMLQADRLRAWARNIRELGPDISAWGSPAFVAEEADRIAADIERAVRREGLEDPAQQQALIDRIDAYYALGGLWNPEFAIQAGVRDLLGDIRACLSSAVGRLPAPELLRDELLLRLWRAVQGPQAQLNGPLIRFAGLVQEMAVPSATGRLPALDALIQQWREEAGHCEEFQASSLSPSMRDHWGATAAVLRAVANELETGLAGLRADPAPRPLIEEQDVPSRVEPSVDCIAPTGSTAERPTGEVTAAALTENRALQVTRFEVIDESGRVLVRRPCEIDLSFQDGNRTLKVFVRGGAAVPDPQESR